MKQMIQAAVTRRFGFAALMLLAALPGFAAEQVVTPSPSLSAAGGNALVSTDVNYQSANPQNVNLTGLGLRIHFNSTRLNFVSVGNVYTAGFVTVNPQVDSGNFDSDAATDRFILLSWADIAAHWPGAEPKRLLTLTFSTVAGFTGSTLVRFSASSTAAGYTLSSTPWQVGGGGSTVRNDINGDGRSDVFWRNAASAQSSIWFMNGGTYSAAVLSVSVPSSWRPMLLGDFNGDGKADALWRNPGSGENSLWLGWNGTTFATQVRVPNVTVAWSPLRASDFNRDGKADIFWRNTSTGQTLLWFMNGTVVTSTLASTTVPPPWVPSVFGDFDNDGATDIFWRNPSTGETSIWRSWNGTAFASQTRSTNAVAPWTPIASGDFNGDSRSDIFLRNTTSGETSIWFMNGSTVTSTIRATTVPMPWDSVSFGDFDGDNKCDIFWRHPTAGQTSIWRGWNGSSFVTQTRSTTVPIAWVPVSP